MLKDLKKLANSVNNAATFAEQIKLKVNHDMSQLINLSEEITANKNAIMDMERVADEAFQTLKKLSNLLGD